ncbi:MAG: hypothetical protein ACKO2G_13085 [Verrucomicrobiales bacterium]
MDLPPRIEEIACPTCGEFSLRARSEGLGAECAACGQLVIFDEDTSTVGKRRNYTPERTLKKMLGEQPAPQPRDHAPVHLPDWPARDTPLGHRGPLPAVKSTEEVRPPVVASHALESARRDNWKKLAALAAMLVVVVGAGLWAWSERASGRNESSALPITGELADPANRILIEGATLPQDDADVAAARNFLQEQILPAAKWEDWMAHVRLPKELEPIMRAYYVDHEYQSLVKSQIRSAKISRTPAGKFVIFLLDHPVQQVAMVEMSADGPRLDWEILTNQPLRDWEAFIKSRPSAPTNIPVAICRCYVREDYLTPEELPNRSDYLGMRVSMPGNPDLLFSAVPLASPLGQWLAAKLPWEHDDKTIVARATLSFAPEHTVMRDRVILHGEPSPGWNRVSAAPPAGTESSPSSP